MRIIRIRGIILESISLLSLRHRGSAESGSSQGPDRLDTLASRNVWGPRQGQMGVCRDGRERERACRCRCGAQGQGCTHRASSTERAP